MLKAGVTALVTGGSGGIGSAIVRMLADQGVEVVAASNDEVSLKALEGVANIETCFVDVTDEARMRELFGERKIDILVNAAGVLGVTGTYYSVPHASAQRIMDVNVVGVHNALSVVVPGMVSRNHGHIINIGSIATTRCGDNPGYAASKVGILGLTRAAARAYAKDNIRCNLVSPGHVDTPFIRGNQPHSPNDWSTSIDNPENLQRRLASTPMGRLVQPEEIAYAYLFLASDEASMVTGTNLQVDGGASL